MFEVIFLYLKGLIRITTVNEKNAITKSTGKIPTTPEKLDKKLALIKKDWCYSEKDCKRTGKAGNHPSTISTTAMNKASESELKEAIMAFVSEYGMLGFMTALPTTLDFITYEAVYLPKNHFIKEENISTERYLSCFFPFDKYVNTAARHLPPQDQTWNSAPHNVRTSTMYIRAGRKKIIYQHRRSNCMGNLSIIMYTTEDGLTKIETTFDEDTVWLSLEQMAELFQRDKSTISRHIKNIFEEGELQRNSVVANFATTASDGKTYQVDYTQSFRPEAVLPALAYLDTFQLIVALFIIPANLYLIKIHTHS